MTGFQHYLLIITLFLKLETEVWRKKSFLWIRVNSTLVWLLIFLWGRKNGLGERIKRGAVAAISSQMHSVEEPHIYCQSLESWNNLQNLLINMLFSWHFCEKIVTLKFRNFHTLYLMHMHVEVCVASRRFWVN